MLAKQPHVEPPVLEEIGQHLRGMLAIYSVSEVARPDIIQQRIVQLKEFETTPSIAATILDQSTLLSAINLLKLAEFKYNKQYNMTQINILCQTIKSNISTTQPKVAVLIKEMLKDVKTNLDKITRSGGTDLQNSKTILQKILEE